MDADASVLENKVFAHLARLKIVCNMLASVGLLWQTKIELPN